MAKRMTGWLLGSAVALLLTVPAQVNGQEKMPVLLDTDIGTDIDDAFALGLLLASPEVELRGVTTCASDPDVRAWMVCRFLTAVGKKNIPVAIGKGEQPKEKIEGQFQYRYHPAVIFNRTAKPIKQDAVEFLYEQFKADPGKITLLTTGPLTNVARLLEAHPECKPWIKQIVISAGKVAKVESNNFSLDAAAAKEVFASGVPLRLVPANVGAKVVLPEPFSRKIFLACTPVTFQVQAMYQLWDQQEPTLTDALAAALCFDSKFCQMKTGQLKMTDGNVVELFAGKGSDQMVTGIDAGAFLPWFAKRLGTGQSALPKPPPNPSQLIPADKFPNRVHAFEDFETDIEKRWWMSGKAETKIIPPGSKRACRGVLTQDFDDLQGDMKTMYTAVIFNPVPGPPMGKNPRLSFRYWLRGTDTLRVQIYSLTKGYHRCLTLKGLPQEKWQAATVDMTQVRRPDGSGGPLSENERIDDIQFYVDPRAELIVDDIVLYDAPVAGEAKPFPKQILFTGLFDSGKQGKEWPGKFEIVKNGFFWNAAKSVRLGPTINGLEIGLRGARPLGETTHLFFRYRLMEKGGDFVKIVSLNNQTHNSAHDVRLTNLKQGEWSECTVNFSADSVNDKKVKFLPRLGDVVDSIRFFMFPVGDGEHADLLVDDLLLYVPGKQ